MIVIGSTALKYFGLNRREPKDLDVFIREDEIIEVKCDKHIIPNDLYDLLLSHTTCSILNPDAIYTLKCSHFAWDQHWEKTKQDILWLKHINCKIIPRLYSELKQYWMTVHGNKDFLSLKKSKEYFFNDFVKYKYDHDYLHELVSYPNKPIYTFCLKDGEDVLISKKKFDQLKYEDQIRMFREEITVIACERWLLQDNNKISWYESYILSLRKTITNLTKNWANDFIILNLDKFTKPDYNYFEHLLTSLEK
jgi:hypothetical protein